MRRALLVSAVLAFVAIGCGEDDDGGGDDDDRPADSGLGDGGGRDGGDGGRDGGGNDAAADGGSIDGGNDAGNIDSGQRDTGTTDSSVAADGGASSDASMGGRMDGGGAGDGGAADGAAGDGGTTVAFSALYNEIFKPMCGAAGTCHDNNAGMLNLSTLAIARMELVGVMAEGPGAGNCNGMGTRVIAGNPDASLLIQKLTLNSDMVCGDRMPRNASPLPEAQVQRIRTWISQGAVTTN